MKRIFFFVIISMSQLLFSQEFNDIETTSKLNFNYWLNKKIDSSITDKKPVVLEFWASWCKPCLNSIPKINYLSKKYKSKIIFISINSYETKEKIKEVLEHYSFSSYLVIDQEQYLLKSLKIGTIPATILVDKNKKIRWRGNSKQLTTRLLENFLKNDTIISNSSKRHDFNDTIVVKENNKLNHIIYMLNIKESEGIGHKILQTKYDDGFLIKLQNIECKNMIEIIYNELGNYDRFIFKGNIPKELFLDLSVISDNKNSKQSILNDLISNLQVKFNFSLSRVEEQGKSLNKVTFF